MSDGSSEKIGIIGAWSNRKSNVSSEGAHIKNKPWKTTIPVKLNIVSEAVAAGRLQRLLQL